jgi:hypothetical protein
MHKAVATILLLALTTCSGSVSARYVEGDPLGVIPVVPIANMPTSPMLTPSKAITASDVLKLRQLNHSYAYVSNSPLRWTDPSGLQQTYGLPWVMPPNYMPFQSTCICPQPQGGDPAVAGQIIGGSMLGFGGAGAIAGGVAGVGIASGHAAGALGGLVIAEGAASGTMAGGLIGTAIGTVVGVGIAGAYYYSSNNSCNVCCQR